MRDWSLPFWLAVAGVYALYSAYTWGRWQDLALSGFEMRPRRGPHYSGGRDLVRALMDELWASVFPLGSFDPARLM
jgi:hypothetical protein